jgi:hypothetical protein
MRARDVSREYGRIPGPPGRGPGYRSNSSTLPAAKFAVFPLYPLRAQTLRVCGFIPAGLHAGGPQAVSRAGAVP